jgi:hypothetical protein
MSRRLRRQYAWAIHHPPSLKLRRDESSFAKANVAPQHWHEWWLFGSFPATGWKREGIPGQCRLLTAVIANRVIEWPLTSVPLSRRSFSEGG